MIEVHELWKRHGAQAVLRGISLAVKRGEVAVIVGPSGGGKSTFLRCLNGLDSFEAGRVTIDQRLVHGIAASGTQQRHHRHPTTHLDTNDFLFNTHIMCRDTFA